MPPLSTIHTTRNSQRHIFTTKEHRTTKGQSGFRARCKRAIRLASRRMYDDALTEINAAINKRPSKAIGYLIRAAIHQALNLPLKSLTDLEIVLSSQPDNPTAYRLRSIVFCGM